MLDFFELDKIKVTQNKIACRIANFYESQIKGFYI